MEGQIDLFSVDLSSFTVLDSVEDTGPEEVCKSLTHLLYVGSWLISSHSFKKKKFLILFLCPTSPCVWGGMIAGVHRSQKRSLDPLELPNVDARNQSPDLQEQQTLLIPEPSHADPKWLRTKDRLLERSSSLFSLGLRVPLLAIALRTTPIAQC